MADFMASKAVKKAAGSLPKGPTATYPPATRNAPGEPRRAGSLQSLAVGEVDPNRNHVSMSENDRRMLGILPKRMEKNPNRSGSKQ